MTAPPIQGIAETVLYADDLDELRDFYADMLGLKCTMGSENLYVFEAGTCQTLLLFQRGWCDHDRKHPGGVIPGHRGDGPAHMAFHVSLAHYERWKDYLGERGLPVVSEVIFNEHGRSLYFHDPAGNVIELATPGHWSNF